MDYEAWIDNLRAQLAAEDADDYDLAFKLEEAVRAVTPDEDAAHLAELCESAGRHVAEWGADAVGSLLWYAMGVRTSLWATVVEASIEQAEATVLAVKDLYTSCFLPHLQEWPGCGQADSPLGTACYMLWDMDGGLSSIVYHHEPKRLAQACYEVLEHTLSLRSEACIESALHGLGHVTFTRAEPGRSIIDSWLASKPDVPQELLDYARAAWAGAVQ